MPLTKPVIAAENLSFGYKGKDDVLQDVTFSIESGAYVGLIGPNGGGKTTLLRVLLGQLTPSSGSISIFGLSPRHAAQHRYIGYVQQRVMSQDVILPLTVRELVLNAALLPGLAIFSGASRKRTAVNRVFEQLGITHLADRLLSSLSGGERQRAFIARALVNQPRLLILDEPTTGVDPKTREEFHELLASIHRSGVTLLYVSHDTDVIAKYATHLLCLNKTLDKSCSPQELAKNPNLNKLYGETMTHVHHHHHHHHHGHAHDAL